MRFDTRTVLLCTVGTSLFESNLKNLPEKNDTINKAANQYKKNQFPDNWSNIRNAYKAKNWKKLAQELACIDPAMRICGAEINTINEVITIKKAPIEEIYFLVSDTETGRDTGSVLEAYFGADNPIKKVHTHIRVIEKLQDQNPKDFKIQGLRNLVREIGSIVALENNLPRSIIDATGGYKAQIAIAVAIGQILKIPVIYKHERFQEIIDFPPLPISFDFSVLGSHADILSKLEKNEIYTYETIMEFFDGTEKEKHEIFETMRVFLTEVPTKESTILYSLSPMGQVYLTSYRAAFPKPPPSLKPAENRKEPTFGNDHHYPSGFKEFVTKIWKETRWIQTIYSTDYSKQKAIHGTLFAIKTIDKSKKIMGTYKSDFGARFIVEVGDDANDQDALTWAVDYLNNHYGD